MRGNFSCCFCQNRWLVLSNRAPCTKKDIFHVMAKMYLPRNHGLFFQFYQAFRDAIFEVNKEDLDAVKQVLGRREGLEVDKFLAANSKYLQLRVRRRVRGKTELHALLKALFESYQDRRDGGGATGKRLFNKLARKEAAKILLHVQRGCLDDLAGVALYHEMGEDADRLKLYRCVRGTNGTENIHQRLLFALGSWNAGVKLADCVLADFRHRHNLRAGHRNRADVPWYGFYALDLVERIAELECSLFGDSDAPLLENTHSYADTNETFGVGPLLHLDGADVDFLLRAELSKCTQEALGLTPNQRFLSEKMGVPVPPLPVTTPSEKALFNRLVPTFVVGKNKPRLDANRMAVEWVKHVNIAIVTAKKVHQRVWPKLPSQLAGYFTVWQRAANKHTTLQAFNDELADLVALAEELRPEPAPAGFFSVGDVAEGAFRSGAQAGFASPQASGGRRMASANNSPRKASPRKLQRQPAARVRSPQPRMPPPSPPPPLTPPLSPPSSPSSPPPAAIPDVLSIPALPSFLDGGASSVRTDASDLDYRFGQSEVDLTRFGLKIMAPLDHLTQLLDQDSGSQLPLASVPPVRARAISRRPVMATAHCGRGVVYVWAEAQTCACRDQTTGAIARGGQKARQSWSARHSEELW
jgi:hypothetical protein